jgi:hypothetical protein
MKIKNFLPYVLTYGFAGFFFIGGWVMIGAMIYQGFGLQKYIFPESYWTREVSEREASVKELEQLLIKAIGDIRLSQLQEEIEATDAFRAKETLRRALSGVSPEQSARQEEIIATVKLRLKEASSKAQLERIEKIEKQIEDGKQALEAARRKLREYRATHAM